MKQAEATPGKRQISLRFLAVIWIGFLAGLILAGAALTFLGYEVRARRCLGGWLPCGVDIKLKGVTL